MHGQETFKPMLYIFLMLIVLFIFISMLEYTPIKEALFGSASNIELTTKNPYVSPIGPDSCSGTTCAYNIQINDFSVRSRNETYAFVSMTYKDKRLLLPCPTSPQSDGACIITPNGITLNLRAVFSGSVWTMPPTLIANDTTSYTGTIIDGQKITIGNFSVVFSYVDIPIIKDRAQYSVTCANEGRLFSQYVGDKDRYTMCDGEIIVKTIDFKSSPYRAHVNIITNSGKNSTEHDNVDVALWDGDLLFCSNLTIVPENVPVARAQPIEMPEEIVQKCFGHMLATWTLDVPLSKWDMTTWSQPAF